MSIIWQFGSFVILILPSKGGLFLKRWNVLFSNSWALADPQGGSDLGTQGNHTRHRSALMAAPRQGDSRSKWAQVLNATSAASSTLTQRFSHYNSLLQMSSSFSPRWSYLWPGNLRTSLRISSSLPPSLFYHLHNDLYTISEPIRLISVFSDRFVRPLVPKKTVGL